MIAGRNPNRSIALMLLTGGLISLVCSAFFGSRAIVLATFLICYATWIFFSPVSSRVTSLALALGAALLYFLVWPDMPLGDDAAIVLKYMDNFAQGYMYCYNPQDGPVFGISGFVHGVVSGGLAWSHLLSPLASLYTSNFIGLVLVSYISFRILAWHTGEGNPLLFLLWAMLLLTSNMLIMNARNGLETPIHLALVLACLLFYLQNNTRMLLLLSVVAIVSKLDAVPIVGMLVIANVARNWSRFQSPSFRSEYGRSVLLYGVVPLVFWIVVSTALFGSPLPQTAYAKFMYRRDTTGDWFPFLEALFNEKNRMLLVGIVLACIAYVAALVYFFKKKSTDKVLTIFIYGSVIAAYLLLYYVYNPAERMGWYYVLPAFVLGIQCIVLLFESLLKRVERYAIIIGITGIVCYVTLYWPRVESQVQRYAFSLNLVENERQAVGQWIREHSVPTDTLLTGYGHVAERAGLYTIDYSGLNSKVATDFKLDVPRIAGLIDPRWIVLDTLLTDREGMCERYELRRSYFNLASLGKETWRIYERRPERVHGQDRELTKSMVDSTAHVVSLRGGGISCTGNVLSLTRFGEPVHARSFVVGLTRRAVDLVVSVSFALPDGRECSRHTATISKQDTKSFVDGYTMEWQIPLSVDDGISSLTIAVMEPQGQEVEILSPAFIGVRGRNN